jgi:peptidoglycan/xylan/chitin deacetylase (PgdA/CDA1 family)
MTQHAATLTFDDGPDPVWTSKILEVLREQGARATFFPIAARAAAWPRLIREMLDAGHGVEFHCTRHLRHTQAPRGTIAADALEGLRTLRALGAEPRFWRPPWGIVAPSTGEIAEELDLTLVGWTADTHDWRGEAGGEMLHAIDPLLGPGAVVLMHDGLGPGALRDGCGETVTLTAALVPRLRALGCEPAPLDALESVPPPRRAAGSNLPEVSV